MRVLDHREQALRRTLTVDEPVGVEDLVAAMLGVRLREHHELDVGRIALQRRELRLQIIDLVTRQRQAELAVSPFERAAPAGEHVDRAYRPRLVLREQQLLLRPFREQRLRHAIVQQRRDALPLGLGQGRAHGELDDSAAFDTLHRQCAQLRDVGGLRGPRRDRAEPRDDVQALPAARRRCRAAAVIEQRRQHPLLGVRERPLEIHEVLEVHGRVGHRRGERAQLGAKLFEAERSRCRRDRPTATSSWVHLT